MVDGGGLENHCTRKGTGGSNPSPSANSNLRAFDMNANTGNASTSPKLPRSAARSTYTPVRGLVDGLPGESLFSRPFSSVFRDSDLQPLLKKVKETADDRLEAIVRALVVENRVDSPQQAFLEFVLSHYVRVGVEELDQAKLTLLLRLKYHDSIADAVADLGPPDEIGRAFAGFQKYLLSGTSCGIGRVAGQVHL